MLMTVNNLATIYSLWKVLKKKKKERNVWRQHILERMMSGS